MYINSLSFDSLGVSLPNIKIDVEENLKAYCLLLLSLFFGVLIFVHFNAV
jgi:hypothetical protein